MDTVKDALNLLSMHFGNYDKESNIGKIIKSMFANDDEFYQTAEDLRNVLDLNKASGKNLDFIHGKNKNLDRGNLSDEEYKTRLKLETKVNNSDGDIKTIEEAAKVLFGDSFKGVEETGDAEITTTLDMNNQDIPNETYEKAITSGVTSFYNMRDETETLIVVLNDVTFQRFIYVESGTQQAGGKVGVIL
ncbi:MAG: DUF2612 domain-containing protein [Clostridiales bacterium]|nr:DUF2612 domain-containing protein [Clostridiales bacterium]